MRFLFENGPLVISYEHNIHCDLFHMGVRLCHFSPWKLQWFSISFTGVVKGSVMFKILTLWFLLCFSIHYHFTSQASPDSLHFFKQARHMALLGLSTGCSLCLWSLPSGICMLHPSLLLSFYLNATFSMIFNMAFLFNITTSSLDQY